MDEDLGYLPGSEQEKIDPYMRAVRDNLFTLMSGHNITEAKEIEQVEDTVQMLFDKRIIQTEALAYQRGRSLQRYWMILDEMQNSTPRQAKGVITRPGIGTKIILLGDPDLPDALLPPDWPGHAAAAMTATLYAKLAAASSKHVVDCFVDRNGALRPADASFRARFVRSQPHSPT